MADTDKLALGLDDIIRLDRSKSSRGGRGARRGGNRGGNRGRPFSGNSRGTGMNNGFRTRGGGGIPRASNPPTGRWKHDLYEDNGNAPRSGGRLSGGVNSTTKILIENLDFGVTSEDIEELFEDIGAIRKANVHFDESGRSIGTAEVVYERRADAIAAQKKYNGVNLDNRPMQISIVGGSEDRPEKSFNRLSQNNGSQRGGFRINNQQNNNRGSARSRLRGGKPQNGDTNGNAKKENVTAEDLDAELEAYRAAGAPKK